LPPGINEIGGKILPSVPLVLLTGGKLATGANDTCVKLPPVLTTPVENNGNNSRLLTT
jgi:hypothetical protein